MQIRINIIFKEKNFEFLSFNRTGKAFLSLVYRGERDTQREKQKEKQKERETERERRRERDDLLDSSSSDGHVISTTSSPTSNVTIIKI